MSPKPTPQAASLDQAASPRFQHSSTGSEEGITALTDDGIGELNDMLYGARHSPDPQRASLKGLVVDHDIIARVKEKGLR